MAAEGLSLTLPAGAQGVCVNGAAAGWPRKVVLMGAGRAGGGASMGPRPDGRGRYKPRRELCGMEKRQWGRGRMAAEGAFVFSQSTTSSSVNGAAAGWPRKVFCARVIARPLRRQWGRGRMAAEGFPKSHLCQSANMRQWGRGRMAAEGVIFCSRSRSPDMRQWGRGRMAAEGVCRHCGGGRAEWRQWGRGRMAAEGGQTNALTVLERLRQWGRGRMAAEGLS